MELSPFAPLCRASAPLRLCEQPLTPALPPPRQSWEFNASSTNPIIREKAHSFEIINGVADTACNVLGIADGCGQTADPSLNPSFRNLDRQGIIDRLKINGPCGVGHWIQAASQPWGKLFGGWTGYNNGCNLESCDAELEHVTSFVYTLYQVTAPIASDRLRSPPTASDCLRPLPIASDRFRLLPTASD